MCLAHYSNDHASLLYSLGCIFDLENSSLWRATIILAMILLSNDCHPSIHSLLWLSGTPGINIQSNRVVVVVIPEHLSGYAVSTAVLLLDFGVRRILKNCAVRMAGRFVRRSLDGGEADALMKLSRKARLPLAQQG